MIEQAPIAKRELKTSIALIAFIVGVLTVSSFLLLTQYWFVWPALLVSMLIVIGYFAASKSLYQCPPCNNAFKITALQDFFAPHGITKSSDGKLLEWKLLKCPQCGKRMKCHRVYESKNSHPE